MTASEKSGCAPRRGFVAAVVAALCGLLARRADAQSSLPPATTEPIRIGRRVITGVDAEGRSRVDSEQPVPASATWKNGGAEGLDFWIIRELPTPLTGPIEPTPDWHGGNRAPSGGAFGRLLTWAPGFAYPRHTTPTLDFILVLSGRLELILDTESRLLNAGDVVIQRGTAHAWRVPGPEPCTFAGIGMDARPRA